MNIDKKRTKKEYKMREEKKYIQVNLKKDSNFKKFEEICKKANLKKASVISKLIRLFNENPEKYLF